MRRIVVAFASFALLLTGCADGQPPDGSGLPSLSPTRSLDLSDRPSRPTDTSKPEPTTSKPEPTKSKPEPTTSEPEPTTSEPEPTTSEPEPTTSKPEPTTSEPEPTTSEPSATPSLTDPTEPTATETDSTPWLWLLLLVALAVAGGVLWWVLGRRRRAAEWQQQFDAATTEVGWLLEQQVSAVVEAPSAEAMTQAGAETQTRISDVDRKLFGLRDSAPSESERQTLDATRSALEELRAALLGLVEGVRGAASPDVQRQQTVRVERARESLRRLITPADGASA